MAKSLLMQHNVSKYASLEKELLDKHIAVYRTTMGTGKTFIGAELVRTHNWKTLVLSPKSVVDDMWTEISKQYHLPITTMTYQKFMTLTEDDVKALSERYSLLICDEAHHVEAAQWSKNLRLMRNLMLEAGKYILGLTADTIRYSGKEYVDVADTFFGGNLVMGYTAAQAIDQGILPSFEYIAALFGHYLPEKKDTSGLSGDKREKVQKLMSKLEFSLENAYSINGILKKHMGKGNHKVIVFIENHDDEKDAMQIIRKSFPEAVYFHLNGRYGRKRNAEILEGFEKEKGTAVLSAVNLLNEGMHIDGVDTLIMLRRTELPSVFFQQLGRISAAGKKPSELKVFDFVGNHSNVVFKNKTGATGTAIENINGEITDKERQIIISDYTKDPREIMREIDDLFSGVWSEEEVSILKKWYPQIGRDAVKYLPGRTKEAVKARALILGLKAPDRSWSKEELETLKKYWPAEGAEVYKRLPGRTRQTCYAIASSYGIANQTYFWTKEEDDALRRYYPSKGSACAGHKELAARSKASVQARAVKLGLSSARIWSEKEKQILRDHVSDPDLFSLLPSRSRQQILVMASKLGVKVPSHNPPEWTPEELSLLRRHYAEGKESVMSHLSGRTWEACQHKANALGLQILSENTRKWTPEEEEILKRYYPAEGEKAAERIPRKTKHACMQKARSLGIKKMVEAPYSDRDIEIMKKYYPSEGADVVKRMETAKSGKTVSHYASSVLGLVYKGERAFTKFSDEEVAILKKYWPTERYKVVDRLPGRNYDSVRKKAKKLGLK